jgi:hypothetical protein
MDPELKWLLRVVITVGTLKSLYDQGKRRGWL